MSLPAHWGEALLSRTWSRVLYHSSSLMGRRTQNRLSSLWGMGMESGTISTIQDSGMPSCRHLLKSRLLDLGLSVWSSMIRAGDCPIIKADSSRLVASSMELQVYMVASSINSPCSKSQRNVHWLSLSRLPGEDGDIKKICPM